MCIHTYIYIYIYRERERERGVAFARGKILHIRSHERDTHWKMPLRIHWATPKSIHRKRMRCLADTKHTDK